MIFFIFLQRQVINCILAGTGLLFSGVIFHIGTKEPKAKDIKLKTVRLLNYYFPVLLSNIVPRHYLSRIIFQI